MKTVDFEEKNVWKKLLKFSLVDKLDTAEYNNFVLSN